jgi:hypothetical protein
MSDLLGDGTGDCLGVFRIPDIDQHRRRIEFFHAIIHRHVSMAQMSWLHQRIRSSSAKIIRRYGVHGANAVAASKVILRPFRRSADVLVSMAQMPWLHQRVEGTAEQKFRSPGVHGANAVAASKEAARQDGITLGFWAYFKVGAPLTVLSILFGAWWL